VWRFRIVGREVLAETETEAETETDSETDAEPALTLFAVGVR